MMDHSFLLSPPHHVVTMTATVTDVDEKEEECNRWITQHQRREAAEAVIYNNSNGNDVEQI